jgi:hypothetical protein
MAALVAAADMDTAAVAVVTATAAVDIAAAVIVAGIAVDTAAAGMLSRWLMTAVIPCTQIIIIMLAAIKTIKAKAVRAVKAVARAQEILYSVMQPAWSKMDTEFLVR